MSAMTDLHIPPTDHFESDLDDYGSDTENHPPDSPMSLLDIIGAADDTVMTKERIRCTSIDGVMKISIYDVMQYVCGYQSTHTTQTFKKVIQQFPEVYKSVVICKFPGAGQRDTPVADSKGLLKILMHIRGRRSAVIRDRVADIANRFFSGDLSLCADIREIDRKLNQLEESDPTNPALAFRSSSVSHENQLSDEERESRKRKRKMEDEMAEVRHKRMLEEEEMRHKKVLEEIELNHKTNVAKHEIEMSKLDAERMQSDAERMQSVKNIKAMLDESLDRSATDLDRMFVKDYWRNQVRLVLHTAPTEGNNIRLTDAVSDDLDSTNQPTVTVSDAARELRVPHRNNNVLKKYGRAVAELYRQKYGEEPPRREQFVQGRPVMVKHYFEKDNELVNRGILSVVNAAAS